MEMKSRSKAFGGAVLMINTAFATDYHHLVLWMEQDLQTWGKISDLDGEAGPVLG